MSANSLKIKPLKGHVAVTDHAWRANIVKFPLSLS